MLLGATPAWGLGVGPWLVPSQPASRPSAMKLGWGLPLGAFV